MDFREFYQKPSIFRAKWSFQLFLAVLFQTLIDSFWEEIFTYPEEQFWMITFLQKIALLGSILSSEKNHQILQDCAQRKNSDVSDKRLQIFSKI